MKKMVTIILMGIIIRGIPAVTAFAADDKTVVSQIPASEMKIEANSEHIGAGIAKAFDSNDNTFWDSAWSQGDKGLGEKPVYINIEFNAPKDLEKFVYRPRQDDNTDSMLLEYKIHPHHNLSLRLFLKSRIMIDKEFFYVKKLTGAG